METNLKIRRNSIFNAKHFGGGVILIYSGAGYPPESFLETLGELKENNPNYKVTTMLFVNEEKSIKGHFRSLIVNFEEK